MAGTRYTIHNDASVFTSVLNSWSVLNHQYDVIGPNTITHACALLILLPVLNSIPYEVSVSPFADKLKRNTSTDCTIIDRHLHHSCHTS